MQKDEQTGADMLRELIAFLGKAVTRKPSDEWMKDSSSSSALM